MLSYLYNPANGPSNMEENTITAKMCARYSCGGQWELCAYLIKGQPEPFTAIERTDVSLYSIYKSIASVWVLQPYVQLWYQVRRNVEPSTACQMVNYEIEVYKRSMLMEQSSSPVLIRLILLRTLVNIKNQSRELHLTCLA
jgi:hypothetical protein